MRFSVEQRYDTSAETLFDVFADPATHESLPEFGRISRPELLDVVDDGALRVVSMRYRFTADLPAAALAIIDPKKLTWVEQSTYDRDDLTMATVFVPDHYGSKMVASAAAQFSDDGPGSIRRVSGDFRVKILLGAGTVERAIVSGLREHLDEEATHVADLLENT